MTRWVESLVQRMHGADSALAGGELGKAFDDLSVVYRSITLRWPPPIRTEEALDAWFEGLAVPALDAPPVSDTLSDLLWMRVQLGSEETERRGELLTIAEDLSARLDDGDALRREARLSAVVLAVTDRLDDADERVAKLCARFPKDPWIRLELSRAYGRLRDPEARDIEAARRFAEEALALGGGETDLYVYEDVAVLLDEAGPAEALERFERDFWNPARVARALRWYGPEPPLAAIEAAVRLGSGVVPSLISLLEDHEIWQSWQHTSEGSESGQDAWWAAVHAMRLVAALEAEPAAVSVARWLACDVGEVRDVLPLVSARLGENVIEPFLEVLRDRRQPLLARTSAVTGLAAAAVGRPEARDRVLHPLRLWMNDESAPRGIRTEAAYRLALLADAPSRPLIESGLASGVYDGFLFDEKDVAELYEPDAEGPARAMGLDEAPLQVYYEREPGPGMAGRDEAEVEALAQLLDTFTLPVRSPAQAERRQMGGCTRLLDRARYRLTAAATEELGLPAWQESLDLYMGTGARSADDCQRLELEWPFADFLSLDIVDTRGASVARRLLAEPPLMSADERQAVEAMAASRVCLLEAYPASRKPAECRLDESLVLCREFPRRGPASVVRMPAGLRPVRWDVLLGRLVEPPGETALLLYARRLPRQQAQIAVHEIEAAAERIATLLLPSAPRDTAWRIAGAACLAQSVVASADAPPPTLRDVDGEAILFCEAVYEIVDHEALVACISEVEGFYPVHMPPSAAELGDAALGGDSPGDDDLGRGTRQSVLAGFRWVGPEEEDPLLPNARRLYGEGVIRGSRLTLRCHTRDRLVEGRDLLKRAADSALRHRADTFTDPSGAGQEGIEQALTELTAPVDPEQARVLVAQLHVRHYERWLDTSLPVLDDRTPREAAQDPTAHQNLEELVRIIENVEAHREVSQGVVYDTRALREALGLRA